MHEQRQRLLGCATSRLSWRTPKVFCSCILCIRSDPLEPSVLDAGSRRRIRVFARAAERFSRGLTPLVDHLPDLVRRIPILDVVVHSRAGVEQQACDGDVVSARIAPVHRGPGRPSSTSSPSAASRPQVHPDRHVPKARSTSPPQLAAASSRRRSGPHAFCPQSSDRACFQPESP